MNLTHEVISGDPSSPEVHRYYGALRNIIRRSTHRTPIAIDTEFSLVDGRTQLEVISMYHPSIGALVLKTQVPPPWMKMVGDKVTFLFYDARGDMARLGLTKKQCNYIDVQKIKVTPDGGRQRVAMNDVLYQLGLSKLSSPGKWGRNMLTTHQITYAASDAHANWIIYQNNQGLPLWHMRTCQPPMRCLLPRQDSSVVTLVDMTDQARVRPAAPKVEPMLIMPRWVRRTPPKPAVTIDDIRKTSIKHALFTDKEIGYTGKPAIDEQRVVEWLVKYSMNPIRAVYYARYLYHHIGLNNLDDDLDLLREMFMEEKMDADTKRMLSLMPALDIRKLGKALNMDAPRLLARYLAAA